MALWLPFSSSHTGLIFFFLPGNEIETLWVKPGPGCWWSRPLAGARQLPQPSPFTPLSLAFGSGQEVRHQGGQSLRSLWPSLLEIFTGIPPWMHTRWKGRSPRPQSAWRWEGSETWLAWGCGVNTPPMTTPCPHCWGLRLTGQRGAQTAGWRWAGAMRSRGTLPTVVTTYLPVSLGLGLYAPPANPSFHSQPSAAQNRCPGSAQRVSRPKVSD